MPVSKSRALLRFYVMLTMTISAATFLVSYLSLLESGFYLKRNQSPDLSGIRGNEHHVDRKLLSVNKSDESLSGEYPRNLFTLEERRHGAVILHLLGTGYMFLALAIVCDEFFVPALHVISSLLKISDDVAGATFMAAGGSAPELFTSFLGVFVAHSNIGFGTIVGSAVFNILFVIAMCVFFSKGILKLTWWPLLRDCSFYVLSLGLLIQFFRDSEIELWESCLLFVVYILYALFMSINVRAEEFVRGLVTTVKGIGSFVKTDAGQEKNKNLLEFGGACFRHGAMQLVVHTLDPIAEAPMNKKLSIIREIIESSKETDEGYHSSRREASKTEDVEAGKDSGNAFRFSGEVHTHNDGDKTTQSWKTRKISPEPVREIQSPTPNLLGTSNANLSYDNYAIKTDIYESNCSEQVRHKSLDLGRNNLMRHKKHSLADDFTMDTFSDTFGDCKGHLDHRSRAVPGQVDQILVQGRGTDPLSNDMGYHDSPHSIRSFSTAISIPHQSANSFDQDPHPRSGSKLSCTSHNGMSRVCLREAAAEAQGTLDEEDEEPMSLAWPETRGAQFYYVIKFPIALALFLTIPDVRRPGWSRLFPLTFLLSILWIGGFSYLMVWLAALIGQTLLIPEEVIGLTLIAAGTSIPDLITSVIVARQGLGDMAVSSSIGSNIFDVTVGLPVPWIVYSLTSALQPMRVDNNGLFCSTVLLFFMLLAIVCLISLSKWTMTKRLGVAMLLLYVIFITMTVLLQFNLIPCKL